MKKNKIRAILLTSLSFIGMICSLIFYIKSIKVNDYKEYGVSYSCNYDFVVIFLVFLIIFIFGVYELYNAIKNNECKDYSFLVTTLVLALCASYPLSVFFTALSDGNFDYSSNQIYLYIGVLSLLALIACFIYNKIKSKK